MSTIWFKKYGLLYIPAHVMGLMITLAAIVLLVPVYMAIVRNGHSVSDDLYHLFVYTAFWWEWVAEKTS